MRKNILNPGGEKNWYFMHVHASTHVSMFIFYVCTTYLCIVCISAWISLTICIYTNGWICTLHMYICTPRVSTHVSMYIFMFKYKYVHKSGMYLCMDVFINLFSYRWLISYMYIHTTYVSMRVYVCMCGCMYVLMYRMYFSMHTFI